MGALRGGVAACAITVCLFAACARRSSSQPPPPPPVRLGPDIPPLASTPGLSSGFGEFRGAHFHAGLDYSTEEVEGRPVRAVNDGWVERVRASGVGYGRAVYLHLLDGRMVVYGHLSHFAPKLDAYVAAHQDSAGEYEQDLSPREGEIRFAQGEIVAWSGQSGAGPPHLHFELRRGDTNFNPLLHGYALPDHVAPTLAAAWITPHGPGARVDGGLAAVRVPLGAAGGGAAGPGARGVAPGVTVRGAFDLAVDTWDRADGKPNKLATYRLEARLDGAAEPAFEAVIDSFSWDTTVEVERVYDYAATLAGDDDRRTLALLPTYREHVVRRGPTAWRLAPGEHQLEITATDEAGNRTAAALAITALDSTAAATPPGGSGARAHPPRGRSGTAGNGNLRLVGATLYLTGPVGAAPDPGDVPDLPAADSAVAGRRITRAYDLSRLAETRHAVESDGRVAGAPAAPGREFDLPGRGGYLMAYDSPGEVDLRVTGPAGAPVLELAVPPHTFFEPTALRLRATDPPPPIGELSPRSASLEVLPAEAVLAHACRVRFTPGTTIPEQAGVGLFLRQEHAWEYIGARDSSGAFAGTTRRLGTFAVLADTRPPTIGARSASVTWRRGRSHATLATPPAAPDSTLAALLDSLPPALAVTVRDLGSGLAPADQSILVDGRRVPAEYDPESSRLTWRPRAWPASGEHAVRIEAVDRCGNRSVRALSLRVD